MENRALAGRYALGERVGTGGMADVFAARDTRLERNVAVKLFRPGTADGLERGSAEARLLAGLDHPGLVRVLDMDSGENAADGAYLVMELVSGPDLGVRLRKHGALSREGVRLMALDLARTLQYIHGRGIVHRDIKPSNILTRDADPHSGLFQYLLTDFGIARFFDGGRMTATGQVIGSAAYFSPEQTRGDDVGQASDIYSLGLVMIEALTGERAFPGTGVESALARLHRSPSIPHAAGPALSALLISMTLDDPANRPDAASVVRALTVMGPQQAGEPITTALPVSAPDTASSAVPGDAATGMMTGTMAGTTTGAGEAAAGGRSSQRGEPETTRLPPVAAVTRMFAPTADPGAEASAMLSLPADAAPTAAPGRTSPDNGSAGRRDGGVEEHSRSARTRTSDVAPPARRRRAVPWLIAILVVALLAAALWAFMTLSGGGASSDEIEPLPAVPGEPGERLQELYESVQQ
ncbi:serine/threonine protein kinase [Arthrobacter sp. NamB2]|uniref:serine/threonine-protein kinase n=1 Tax=Arthrobacter sp. NamB2 TaxID=2576035 RepID=UPI0010C991BC|nr:serine/threonine-protein kinase [Arthrobacter sp. NamB2]TKV27841.1 serine/threonine protein kinase [Arthrobacter sp. NamB2]